jgi:hypothetical protein
MDFKPIHPDPSADPSQNGQVVGRNVILSATLFSI